MSLPLPPSLDPFQEPFPVRWRVPGVRRGMGGGRVELSKM